MRIKMTQMLIHNLKRNLVGSTILYQLSIKLFPHKKIWTVSRLSSYLLVMPCNRWITSSTQYDIDVNDLYVELIFSQRFQSIRKYEPYWNYRFFEHHGYFFNITIAYRVLLIILVTVASVEHSFSKLNLLQNYLSSTM